MTTIIVGKYLNILGRKKIVMASLFLTSASMVILSPIEDLQMVEVIIVSIFSRIIGGIGAGCMFTPITTIFISDYPDQIQKMIGRMQAMIGLGLILGPLIGTALFLINLFTALMAVGVCILLFAFASQKMLGTFREYIIHDIKINRLQLFFKPVMFT